MPANYRRRGKDICLGTILQEIRHTIQLVEQWKGVNQPAWVENQLKYMNQLECLVEIVEVYDCGSTGGFGVGQGFKKGHLQVNDNHNPGDLFDRANWLLAKYKGKS